MTDEQFELIARINEARRIHISDRIRVAAAGEISNHLAVYDEVRDAVGFAIVGAVRAAVRELES